MDPLLASLAVADHVLRILVFGAAGAVGVIALVDWAARTRRLSPFGAPARFCRQRVDPLLAPIERQLVRAGLRPHNAPWWALLGVMVVGLLLLELMGFIEAQVASVYFAASAGPVGIVRLLVSWVFAVLKAALIWRVISSWLQLSPWSRWVRWSYTLTEWMLRPLRRIIPPLGMLDMTPIVAYFALYLVEMLVL